jgi:hypothetical protein
MRATEAISKPFRHQELQQTAILHTAHILQHAVLCNYKVMIMGFNIIFIIQNNITFTIYCNHTIAAILFMLETLLVSGTVKLSYNIIITTFVSSQIGVVLINEHNFVVN